MALDPALSQEVIKEFVTAAHFDLSKVQTMLADAPALLHVAYEWSPGDWEQGIMAAAHMGNRAIAEFFLAQGSVMNICVAAMLGRTDDVKAFLEGDRNLANARGAHQITVMFHAAMSGSTDIARLLKSYGCNEGYSYALHGAIDYGHPSMVEWLLDNGVQNINALNFEGKTPLKVALEKGYDDIASLIRARGGLEEPG
jgi:ankyrin repeat protein